MRRVIVFIIMTVIIIARRYHYTPHKAMLMTMMVIVDMMACTGVTSTTHTACSPGASSLASPNTRHTLKHLMDPGAPRWTT